MAIRKYGTEPAKTETRASDNDQDTLAGLKAETAAGIEEFLAHPETGVVWDRASRTRRRSGDSPR